MLGRHSGKRNIYAQACTLILAYNDKRNKMPSEILLNRKSLSELLKSAFVNSEVDENNMLIHGVKIKEHYENVILVR